MTESTLSGQGAHARNHDTRTHNKVSLHNEEFTVSLLENPLASYKKWVVYSHLFRQTPILLDTFHNADFYQSRLFVLSDS